MIQWNCYISMSLSFSLFYMLYRFVSLSLSLAPEFHCDQGYLLYGDYCYHFESESVKTWQDAENYCVSQNGHLASIHNQETVSFITGERQTADRRDILSITCILFIINQIIHWSKCETWAWTVFLGSMC